MKALNTDVVIIGSGVSGLYSALHLSKDLRIIILSKDSLKNSDSYLAQGGICVLRDESDYKNYYEDTMKAGHYENNPQSVEIMLRSSMDVIQDLINYGVQFERKNGDFLYTREAAHSQPRILYHQDITGQEITSHLLSQVQSLSNVSFYSNTTMTDWICSHNSCYGIIAQDNNTKENIQITAKKIILATGGIGGLYQHSTNFPHLTGDSISLAKQYHVNLKNLDYVQIHPTTLYSQKPGRRFLISESVRGENSILLDSSKRRFVNELLPRDILTAKIYKQMKKDNTPYVLLSMVDLGIDTIMSHFPNIYVRCLQEGYDVTKVPIPVVPAQHYFMGGIAVNTDSHTSMNHLYAVGETACNGVHGANRLASNSLLESLVFSKRAAIHINTNILLQKQTIHVPSY